MYGSLKERLSTELQRIEAEGLIKRERVITSPQARRASTPSPAAGC